jgi:hypothetical protein
MLISALTKNEDLRQDLWVAYLSGEIDSTFSKKLQQLSISLDVEKRASERFQEIIDLDIAPHVLDQLSDLQCLILFMTILGYSAEPISIHTGIMRVHIVQFLVTLKDSNIWKFLQKNSKDTENGI